MSIIARIFSNWKTSVGGLSLGTILGVVAYFLLNSGCTSSTWIVWLVVCLVVGGPTAVGILSTDNKAGV